MARKNAKGSGTIRKKVITKNGKSYTYWESRITIGHDPGTGKQIQKSFTGKTQKEVREKLQAAAVDVNNGVYRAPSKMRLGDWLDIWLAEYQGDVKPMTVESHGIQIQQHIKPALGAIRLDELQPHDIQKFCNSLTGLSPGSVKTVHGVLRKALQQALENGYIQSNPASNTKLPREDRREIQPLDSAAMAAFMEAIKGHKSETIYLVMLFTGIRRGEACGLTWDRVDLDNGTITIDRQLQRIPGQSCAYRFISSKNGKSRTITIAAFLVDVLRRHRIQQLERRLQAGPLWEQGPDFVFTTPTGHHVSPNTLYSDFKKIVASIGLPNARLHDLRHSYAVAALQAGDNIKTVQETLGHHTAAFTLNTYAHVTEEMKKASADRMDSYIAYLDTIKGKNKGKQTK